MSEQRIGDWMQTFTGKKFWPLDPRHDEIDIEDIAHALSCKCRFGGHALRFYSVAEHSVIVSKALPAGMEIYGLFHDAAEAYLPDVIHPIKKSLAGFDDIEAKVMKAVCQQFGLSLELMFDDRVKRADNRALMTERRDVMRPTAEEWQIKAEPLDARIYGRSPVVAETEFLIRFEELRSGVWA